MSLIIQTGTIQIDAGPPSTDTSNPKGFTSVNFPQTFVDTPVVFAMVQSFNGSETPGLRIRNVTQSGFEIRMNELVSAGKALTQTGHQEETIAWMAIQS